MAATGKEMCEAIVKANSILDPASTLDPKQLWESCDDMVWLCCAYQWAKLVIRDKKEPSAKLLLNSMWMNRGKRKKRVGTKG